MTFDADIRCLTIVGCVPAGGRLGHDITGRAYVAMPGLAQSAWRTLSRDGRERTLTTVRQALESVDQRLTDMLDCARQTSRPSELSRRCQAACTALQLCRAGIANLKATYAADMSAQAGLDLTAAQAASVSDKAHELQQVLADHARA